MISPPHSSNRMLALLVAPELEAILPYLKSIELPQETVLFEDGDPIKLVYFPQSGIVSLVVDLASGEMIETGMVGRDSLVGGLSALDGRVSLNRAVVQVAGAASVLPADRVREIAEQSIAFRTTLIRHEQAILAQSQQSAACNAVHSLEARLARWLLRCRDLLGSEEISLTQEFLGQMLGVRRTTVTLAARVLQGAGLISYRRGHIHINDPEGLKECACECYEALRSRTDRLLGQSAAVR
jgi:CRP-like cAMP-binding protein